MVQLFKCFQEKKKNKTNTETASPTYSQKTKQTDKNPTHCNKL